MARPGRPRRGRAHAWLAFLAGVALAAGGCSRGAEAAPSARRPPNLVLIVVDTLRADHLPVYGYPRQTSPNLARLAREGVVFERAFSVISHTLPAHVSLMTGIHPSGHKVLANGLRYAGPFPTLAERLREAGYQTAGFTSGFPLAAESGIERGFQVYRDTRDWLGRRRAKIPGTRVTRAARRWLARSAREPLFLFLHYYDAHPPYLRAEGAAFPFRVDATLDRVMRARGVAEVAVDAVSHAPLTLDGRELSLAEAINTYDNEIHHVDAMIGEILDALAEGGALSNALVVVTSDHGEGLGEHGYYQHGLFLYEEQIHIPLIVRSFGQPHLARRVRSPVSLLDVCATVLDAAGRARDPRLHGRSLLPVLRDGAELEDAWILAQRRFFSADLVRARGRFAAREGLFALRGSGDAKLLWSESGKAELYDLALDPHEAENRAVVWAGERERLRAVLLEQRRRYATSVPAPDPAVDAETRGLLEALGYVP